MHKGDGADGSQSMDQTVLGAAAGDGPREGAAAPRILVIPECLGGQQGRGNFNSCRGREAADGEGKSDRPRGAGGPSEFSDEWVALGDEGK